MSLETWELLSYVVTVVGLPLAIVAYMYEQRKERANEEEEVYQLLSDNYQDFLKVVLENSDLQLFSQQPVPTCSDEQRERMHVDLRHADLAVRARVPAAVRAELARTAPALALLGGLHARVDRPPRRSARSSRSS